MNIAIIGAGATGVELAAELAVYVKDLCHSCDADPNIVNIELIEAAPRILPRMSEHLSVVVEEKIRSLGVNVRKSRAINEVTDTGFVMSDMQMQSPTIVWTAGVRAHHLIKDAGFAVVQGDRAAVDSMQRAVGYDNVFIGGDAAATEDAGMAQTAMEDGEFFADTIAAVLRNKPLPCNCKTKPIYAIPVGPGWAGVEWGKRVYTGRIGWLIRRYVDWHVFRTLMSFTEAWHAFTVKHTKND